ncbi:MAG TPA: nitroreductase family deazaflavin-dependent oxidoreductase [Acidimicrobiia bacterium]|nr:nitroreductase family deazaflavin-dependent oxidoreductase [Acidimicrobiia bacterium]
MSSFRPSKMFRLANRMVTPFIRLGLPIGVKRAPMALLTVVGRKSGLPRTTPVALETTDGGWLLVAVYGVSDWSRNLEAAGTAEVTTRGRTTSVKARRLTPEEAGPRLRDSIIEAPAMIRRMTAPYFTAHVGSPIDEWEREALDHPVFILTPVRAG